MKIFTQKFPRFIFLLSAKALLFIIPFVQIAYGRVFLWQKWLFRWRWQLLFFSSVALSNFLLGYAMDIVLNTPQPIYFIQLTAYIFPAFFLWVLPPFWLDRKFRKKRI